MGLFRRKRIQVVLIRCRKCGRRMKVVAGSVPARERECNLCVFAEVNRAEATRADLPAAPR